MINDKIHLNEIYGISTDPILETFISRNYDQETYEKRKAILILPGGAYHYCAMREADPVALSFAAEGFRTFTLLYSVTNEKEKNYYPTQILETMCAIDYIRKNANKYGVIEDSIALMGFSAGGHLAASYGYLYKDEKILEMTNFKEKDIRPNAICLGYPVITLKEYTHKDSKNNIIGDNLFLEEKLSCELHVDNSYPITYLWATEDDQAVPVENTKLFNDALNNANVFHKTIIYKKGPHGLSIAKEFVSRGSKEFVDEEISKWVQDCSKFLYENM